MAKSITVLFAASEIFPYIKFGGVADFSYSFTLALRALGHDVRVMMPRYGNISERKHQIHFIKRLQDIPINIAGKEELFTVKSSSITNGRYKVQSYITTNFNYFDQRKAIYNDPVTGKPFPDNDERFILFAYSVVKTCLLLNWFPEILHCNDWQTALIPVLAKTLYPNKFKKTKFVLTVHNFANQGEFPESTFDKTGLPTEVKEKLMHNGKFNFLKGGILFSDFVTTVSPTYAKEVLQDEVYTKGLNKILIELNSNFAGILNGIDPWQWNPRFDDDIACKLQNSNFASYKKCNKEDLLRTLGLELNPEIPLIGMISHIEEYKGIKLLLESIDRLLKEDIYFVFLGTGDPNLTKRLQKVAEKYPQKFVFKNVYDEQLAHKIEAGSDIFLMPSIYEPCGYNAIYSVVYGTVPIVRATGGLIDSIEPFNPETGDGVGFVFDEPTPSSLVKKFKEALDAYRNKELWDKIIQNCLSKSFSWKDSAEQYVEIYRNLIK
ncbi:glycogen synthase [Bacteroidetes/Chlorobi group bacterium Naka2016]|jgi:starch synthase|nr:MAG: glycogen synthase [Bacteroidetes/Chlorobi group bacterium Naka2016]